MLPLASDYSTGYAVGEVCARVALAVLTGALARRAVRRRRAEVTSMPPPAVAPASDTSASVGPPGWAASASPMPSARASRAGRPRTGWRSDALAAAVFGALLLGVLVRGVGHDGGRSTDPWESDQGRALHAGFVEGCRQKDPTGVIPCECIFDQLKLRSPGPVQFVQLTSTMQAAEQARDVRLLPPEVAEAFRACPAGAD